MILESESDSTLKAGDGGLTVCTENFSSANRKFLSATRKMISMCMQKLLVHPINVGYLTKRGLKQTLSLCSGT